MPGFNEAIFNALEMKIASVDAKDKGVTLIFDEMSLKSAPVYNNGLGKTEGFEDFGN